MDNDTPDNLAPAARAEAPIFGRRLLGAGLAGVAASLLPAFLSRVAASSDTTEGDDEGVDPTPSSPTPDETTPESSAAEQATTTTEPPRRPTDEDLPIVGFMQQLSAAVVALYDRALDSGGLTEEGRSIFATLREAHQGYGQGAGAILGQDAPDQASISIPGIDDIEIDGSSTEAIAEALLEATAISLATHIDAIGRLEGTVGGEFLASIAVTESRHCVVLAEIAGRSGLDALDVPGVEALEMAEG